MRILILFMLVCARATASAATDILSDTARVEREMRGLIEKYCYDCTCESRRRFFREFVKMLERNPASMRFSFEGIKDTCDFRIFTTDDNNLRCYTWNTYCGGTSTDMGGCVQYRTADGKVHVSKEKMGVSVVGISMLRCNDGRTCYLINDYERGWSNYGAERVFAVTIGKDSIETSHILDKGTGSDLTLWVGYNIPNWYFKTNNGEGWDWLYAFDRKTQTIYQPTVGEHECMTDRYDCYRFDGEKFVCTPNQPGFWLHPSLRDYVSLEALFVTRSFRVRIDRLADGTFRYASWRRDDGQFEMPDMVLGGGSYDKARNCYVFNNKGYTYLAGGIDSSLEPDEGSLANYLVVMRDCNVIRIETKEKKE